MALIAMAVYDTEENKRTELTRRTLESLLATVDFTKNRLIVSDNGSCKATQELYDEYAIKNRFPIIGSATVISNNGNLGTAGAINKAWQLRKAGEHCIKMDNDVVIHNSGASCDWVELMVEAIVRDPKIGIIGLKRKDCWETPWHENPELRSELMMLAHVPGWRWIIVEKVNHVMGTCQMYSSALLDKIGYLYQPKLYGYDDVLASHRSHLAGFYNCMLPTIEIDHIDPGATPYQSWKEKHSGECTQEVIDLVQEYIAGTKSIYYNPFEN